MKGLIQWFKSSSKMKRWMFLVLVGIILSCYGIAEILVMDEMSFANAERVIAIFAVGFVAIVLGLIFLNKRAMEMVIEATDNRMKDRKNVNVNSLIFDKTVYDQGPNIVAIGGGSGLETVLRGLKRYTNNITAIVAISDYGEKITESRKKLNMLPLGDVKNSIISLSSNEDEMSKILNHTFAEGKLKGLEFSDIYFSAMKDVNHGDFTSSILKSNEVLNVGGKVLPVTLDEMKILAELANGYTVEEKSRIPELVVDKFTRISRVRIAPSNCKPAPGVIEAIKNADCIVIGPGSLYTNVIPCLLVNGITKAIKESSAIKVYVSNIMTEIGQTDEYTVADHLKAIKDHTRQNIIDFCIYDTGEIIPEFIKKYNLEGQELVFPDTAKFKGVKFIQKDLSTIVQNEYIRHDPDLVASSIIELVCDDLKYQDKQNDPQYIMLNNRLREEKRINKTKRETEKRVKRAKRNPRRKADMTKNKSKFSNKYRDRISSIREADSKLSPEKQVQVAREAAKKMEKKMQQDMERQKKALLEKNKRKAITKEDKPIKKTRMTRTTKTTKKTK